MKEIDRDKEIMQKMTSRNKELLNKEIMVDQVLADAKKHVKTEKLIGKTPKEFREKVKKTTIADYKGNILSKINRSDKDKGVEDKSAFARSSSTHNKKDLTKLYIPPFKKGKF